MDRMNGKDEYENSENIVHFMSYSCSQNFLYNNIIDDNDAIQAYI